LAETISPTYTKKTFGKSKYNTGITGWLHRKQLADTINPSYTKKTFEKSKCNTVITGCLQFKHRQVEKTFSDQKVKRLQK
jgi:hypothetical protein